MRVLTLNVWAWHGEWPRRRGCREVLVEGLSRLAPDLIAFREMVKNDDYGQADLSFDVRASTARSTSSAVV
jgi:hypothetical protein